MVSAAGLRAAFDGGNAAGEGEHDVLAEILQLLGLAAAKALAQADQQEQRSDAPGDAEHGEKRAQFVGPEGGQRLAHDFEEHPHGSGPSPQAATVREPRSLSCALLCSTGRGAVAVPRKKRTSPGGFDVGKTPGVSPTTASPASRIAKHLLSSILLLTARLGARLRRRPGVGRDPWPVSTKFAMNAHLKEAFPCFVQLYEDFCSAC